MEKVQYCDDVTRSEGQTSLKLTVNHSFRVQDKDPFITV